MPPTRRAVLSCGLAAAVWRLTGRAQGDALARAAGGILNFEAAPARLQLALHPAEPATIYAYDGVIPGPHIRLRQGEELRLKFVNRLTEPTTLSFPGLRAANSTAGIGGLTQKRLKSGTSAEIRFIPPDARFNLYLPHAGLTDPGQQGHGLFGPIIVDEAKAPDVDFDTAAVLSDWNVEFERSDQGRFRQSRDRAGKRPQGQGRFDQWRAGAVETQRPAQRASAPPPWQRHDRASDDGRNKRRETLHCRRRRPAERAVRTAERPVPNGSRRPV